MLPVTLPPSIGKLAGFLSSGVVGAALGRFVSRSGQARPASAMARDDAAGDKTSVMARRAADVVPTGPAVLRRTRTGRLRLPREVAGLTPEDVPALAPVDAFADRLAELPLASWLSIGRSLVESASGSSLRATPYAILEATINDRGLAVAAWYVRDAIETSASYVSPPRRRWTARERRCFAAAHAAAEEAALAMLAGAFLPSEDCAALCAPFVELVSPVGTSTAEPA